GLLQKQYAATVAAGSLAMQYANEAIAQAQARGLEMDTLTERMQNRQENLTRFRAAYHPYCWEVNDVDDLRLAPFHLLATEGQVHTDKSHAWHLNELSLFCNTDEPTLMMTNHRWVDLNDEQAVQDATQWWLDLTAKGGEGMVIKPEQYIAHHKDKLVQPALKVRGQEYLRLIYGPDYTLPDNLVRLRKRGLSKKRSLAERELALGIEALERFVRRDALTKVHQCVFAILALESEEVDGAL
ncbi:MAG: polynucleotide kinase-phosphatase, partial [Bacteroidota bacterium]